MSQHGLNTTSSIRSVSASWGECQIVVLPGRLILDWQTLNYDVAGHRRRDYAVADLPLNCAIELRDTLDAAIYFAAQQTPHATGQWGDATRRSTVRRRSARRNRRFAA